MNFTLKLAILFFIYFNQNGVAQKTFQQTKRDDTTYSVKTPILFRASTLFSSKSIGWQVGLGKYIIQKEVHKFKKSGREKIIKKDRILSFDLSYYYQAGLHHNWFITSSYSMRRVGKRGFYSEFSPVLGFSRTFLTETTYSVNESGSVSIKKFAGNWYVTSGFNCGFGKQFNRTEIKYFFNDLYLKMYVQLLYPNYGFINIKPVQVGTSIDLEKIEKASKRIVKYKRK